MAKETIQEWFDSHRIEGYEDGSFKPDNSITRAEFMTMVNKAYDFVELGEINFTDASADKWYYVEVQKAVKAGYIVGDNDDRVRPSDKITRQEVAVVITRLNDLEKSMDVSSFADKDEIASWALEFVGAVKEAGYMIGDDNKNFNPTNDITRAEALVTLDRSMKDMGEYATIDELSIEGAELQEDFDTKTTTYSAIAATGVTDVVIVADVTTDEAITFALDNEDLEVTTATAIEGGVVYTANVTLSQSDDTVVAMTVSKEGLKDRVYTITIKKSAQ